MEIGRNANYTEIPFRDFILSADVLRETVVIISMYDYYVSESDDQLNDIIKWMQQLMELSKLDAKLDICLILPINIVVDKSTDTCGEMSAVVADFTQYCTVNKHELKTYYVPTLYGPWQPDNLLFHRVFKQQLLKKEVGQFRVSDREYTHDALYIDDAVQSIVQLSDENKTAVFLLKSEVGNQWEQGAETIVDHVHLLHINRGKTAPCIEIKETVVKNETPLTIGLEKQKQHLSRLLSGIINVENE